MHIGINILLVIFFYSVVLYVELASSKDWAMVVMSSVFYVFIFGGVLKGLESIPLFSRVSKMLFVIFAPAVVFNLIIWAGSEFSSLEFKVNFLALVLFPLVYWTSMSMLKAEQGNNPFSNIFESSNSNINIDDAIFGRYTNVFQSVFISMVSLVGLLSLFFRVAQ